MTKSSERLKVGLAKPKAKAVVPRSAVMVPAAIDEAALLGDLRTLVQSARQRIATAAISTQTLLCWHMGRRLGRLRQADSRDRVTRVDSGVRTRV